MTGWRVVNGGTVRERTYRWGRAGEMRQYDFVWRILWLKGGGMGVQNAVD